MTDQSLINIFDTLHALTGLDQEQKFMRRTIATSLYKKGRLSIEEACKITQLKPREIKAYSKKDDLPEKNQVFDTEHATVTWQSAAGMIRIKFKNFHDTKEKAKLPTPDCGSDVTQQLKAAKPGQVVVLARKGKREGWRNLASRLTTPRQMLTETQIPKKGKWALVAEEIENENLLDGVGNQVLELTRGFRENLNFRDPAKDFTSNEE